MKTAKPNPLRMPSVRPKERQQLAILFCILALGYLLTFSGARYGRISDGKEMFAIALSMYEFGELSIPNTNPSQNIQDAPEIYSRYGIGFPLVLQIPLFVADHLQSWFGWTGGDYLFPLTNLILNLLTSLLIAICARHLQFGWWAAFGAALAFAFGSFAWPYISFDFSEPLQAFCLILAFWAMMHASQPNQKRWAWLLLAGFSVAYAIVAKTLLVIAIPAFSAYLWLNSRGDIRQRFGAQAIFGIPIACGIALIAVLNYVRFGSLAETGYHTDSLFSTPLWTGLYGLLVSPGKGLPIYAPLTLLLPFSFYWLYKQRRREVVFLCLLCGPLILTVAKWWSWEGGSSWGPRLLYPLLPFLMLFSVYAADRRKVARVSMILLLALGMAINMMGVLFFFSTWAAVCGSNGDLLPLDTPGRPQREYQVHGGKKYFAAYIATNYIPALSPVLGHAWTLRWRYADIPFPMASLLDKVPVSKLLYGPVTINFEKLGASARQYPSLFRELRTAELMLPAILGYSTVSGALPIRSKTYADNGDRFSAQKDFSRAYYAYRKAYDLGSDSPKLLPKMGAACLGLGRLSEAQRYFEQYRRFLGSDHAK